MQTLRQIKNRIRSIESTKKITRAMQMISSVKLNRTKAAFHAQQAYASKLERVLRDLAADSETLTHPLFEKRAPARNIGVAIIASDSGLCGTYNTMIMRVADLFLDEHATQGRSVIAVGMEASKHLRKKGIPAMASYVRLFGKYRPEMADEIASTCVEMFLSRKIDEAYVAHMRFNPSLRHRAVVERFLPLERPRDGRSRNYLTEPDAASLIGELVRRHLSVKMRSIVLESFTAEHAARMLAMKNATDNAAELIDTLTLQRNKARQWTITQEVLEIANAAEALKG